MSADLQVAHAVLAWARKPGDHGGNPYCKKFVQLAQAKVARGESKMINQKAARALLEAAKNVSASWHQPSRQVPDLFKNELCVAIAQCEREEV